MDSNFGLFIIAGLTLLVMVMFGSQFRGIAGWLRNRNNKRKATPVTSNSQSLTAAPATSLPQPAQQRPAQGVVLAQILEERNQPRMARWARMLPVLLLSVGFLVYFGGSFSMLLESVVPPLNPVVGPLFFTSMFFFLAANVAPLIVVLISNIMLSVREMMK